MTATLASRPATRWPAAPLKYLAMGHPDKPTLERFREWFEQWRSDAENRYSRAVRQLAAGRIAAADFARIEAWRDEIVVNYQHGMRRYIKILRAGRHKPVSVARRDSGPVMSLRVVMAGE